MHQPLFGYCSWCNQTCKIYPYLIGSLQRFTNFYNKCKKIIHFKFYLTSYLCKIFLFHAYIYVSTISRLRYKQPVVNMMLARLNKHLRDILESIFNYQLVMMSFNFSQLFIRFSSIIYYFLKSLDLKIPKCTHFSTIQSIVNKKSRICTLYRSRVPSGRVGFSQSLEFRGKLVYDLLKPT